MHRSLLPSLLLAAGLAWVAAGCGDSAKQPPAISTQQVAAGVPDAFKGAPAAVQTLVAEIVKAIDEKDYPTAWDRLQTLNARPGLTDAQKEFVASSIASVGAEVNKAEETGNEAAQEALRIHRANK